MWEEWAWETDRRLKSQQIRMCVVYMYYFNIAWPSSYSLCTLIAIISLVVTLSLLRAISICNFIWVYPSCSSYKNPITGEMIHVYYAHICWNWIAVELDYFLEFRFLFHIYYAQYSSGNLSTLWIRLAMTHTYLQNRNYFYYKMFVELVNCLFRLVIDECVQSHIRLGSSASTASFELVFVLWDALLSATGEIIKHIRGRKLGNSRGLSSTLQEQSFASVHQNRCS